MNLEMLAREYLLFAAICYPEHFEEYKQELYEMGQHHRLIDRWTEAFIRWFGHEAGTQYVLHLY